MINIIYNAQTGEKTTVEVPDVELPVVGESSAQTIEDRIVALEGATEEIVVALNDKGLIP